MINRRHFFKQGGAALCMAAIAGGASLRTTTQAATRQRTANKQIGLQLYSLRADMRQDPDKTLKAVAGMGYQLLESYGYGERKFFGKSPAEFRTQLSGLGMRMTSSHTGFNVYANDNQTAWDAVKQNMEDTKEAGAKWIVQAGYPGSRFTKLDEVKHLAETFNRVGELAKTFGLKFAYHNHTEEFTAIERRIPYQQYIELTEKELVTFQMDIGHVANVMGDYVGYLLKYPGRFSVLHIRDTNLKTKAATEFGEGDVRMKEVFDLFPTQGDGLDDYFVEQEEYKSTPLESVRMCYEYLNKAPFVRW
ncbi:MAG: sugar phosphate isomerase/epimerase [Tannerellaceae bacterium]|jgi:sugar phosphate isomerase/epimerase|nr:sugar phosphate isomerase/epimerase [Tannerellaceae bacterium]